MADTQKPRSSGRFWTALSLGGAIAGLAGMFFGWQTVPTGARESSDIARQIGQLRSLRERLRDDLEELRQKQAKASPPAGSPRKAGADPQPEAGPGSAMPPEAASGKKAPDEKTPAAAPWRKRAETALDESKVAEAVELLRQAADKAEEPERAAIVALLEQSRRALPKAVLAKLQQLIADEPNDRLQQWVASGEAPEEWAQDFSDRRAADAFRRAAARLLPIAWHNREQTHFDRSAARSLDAPTFELCGQAARLYIFRDLTLHHRQGRLGAATLKQTSDVYGAYGAEGALPALRGLLAAGMEPDAERLLRAVPLEDCEDAAVRGEFDLLSCAALFERCRQMAPECCQPLDAPHPLAGRWRGKEQWQIYVDVAHGKVTFVRANPKREMTMSIVKAGADYLVGLAPKVYDANRAAFSSETPFANEKLAPSDNIPLDAAAGPIDVLGLTLFVASPKTKTMDAYRRLELIEPFVQEVLSGSAETWRDLSDVKHYRIFERYRYANAQTSP